MNRILAAAVGCAAAVTTITTWNQASAAPSGTSADRPIGTYIIKEPDPHALRFGPGPLHRILFMNRSGGTYVEGDDNSSTNTSIIPNGSGTIAAWSYGDGAWTQVMACVREMYSRFDIEVTDVDPGSTAHIESVVGGTPGQVGMPSYVGGVAPVSGDCSVVERAVVFTFAGVYGGDVQAICETVAQESAHALGLDHEYLCEDPMTYLYGCGAKSFQDIAASCGEDGPRTCMCGGSTQNSVQILLDVLGPATTDSTAPAVDITSPANGSTVMPGFAISAIASDSIGVNRVDLYIDGASFSTDTAGPYDFTSPPALSDGLHTIEVRAYDSAGNFGTDSIQVTVASMTDDCPAGCPVGEHCQLGECVPDGVDPLPGETGSSCTTGAECLSGICGESGGEKLCTEPCADATGCPSGFECLPASGGGGVCWPGADVGGSDAPGLITGGCNAVGGGETSALFAGLLAAATLLLNRRRR